MPHLQDHSRDERWRDARELLQNQEIRMSLVQRRKLKTPGNLHFVPQKTVLAAAIGLAISGQMQPSMAATFTVSNLDPSGPGSFAQAISDANGNNLDADDIVFQDGLSGTIDAGPGLTVSGPLTIAGPGRDVITINTACGTGCGDLFTVSSSTGPVTVSGLTLDSNGAGFDQSLIRHNGGSNLTVDDCALRNTGGHTSGNDGGAIANIAGNLTVRNSKISGHISAGNGGAIAVAGPVVFVLENSTISGNSSGGDGGGIFLDEVTDVDISGSIISNNTASHHNGGGIYYDPASTGKLPFTLQDSTVSGNTADNGGGMYAGLDSADLSAITIGNSFFYANAAYGSIGGGLAAVTQNPAAGATLSVIINNSLFDRNSAYNFNGAYARAGGLGFSGNMPTRVQINNTTISNNTTINNGTTGTAADMGGGGLFMFGDAMDLEVVNTTISGNRNAGDATNGGGGVYLYGAGEDTPFDADFLNVTIIGNSSPNDLGGGIAAMFSSDNGDLTLVNSIVAGNSAPAGPDIFSSLTDIDYSLVGDNSDANLNELSAGNIVGTTVALADPMLDSALKNNGGTQVGANADIPLPTHAVLEGSSIIGAADQSTTNSPLTLPATDQRGVGFARIRDGGLEMGAVEYIASAGGSSSSSSSSSNSSSSTSNSSSSSSGSSGSSSSGSSSSSSSSSNSSSSSSSNSSSSSSSSSSGSGGDRSGSGGSSGSNSDGGGGGGGAGGPVLLLGLLTMLGLRRRKH